MMCNHSFGNWSAPIQGQYEVIQIKTCKKCGMVEARTVSQGIFDSLEHEWRKQDVANQIEVLNGTS